MQTSDFCNDPGPIRDAGMELVWIGFAEHPVHLVPSHHFRIMHAALGNELGRINLRISSAPHIELYAGHVGYTVFPEYRGHGYARLALRALLPFASRAGIDPLWITCDPDNIASRRTLEGAGAECIEVLDVPEDSVIFKSGHPRKCRYRLRIS